MSALNVCDGSNALFRPRYAARVRDHFSALVMKMKKKAKAQPLYFLIRVESYKLD